MSDTEWDALFAANEQFIKNAYGPKALANIGWAQDPEHKQIVSIVYRPSRYVISNITEDGTVKHTDVIR
jgi:hypothetical protein